VRQLAEKKQSATEGMGRRARLHTATATAAAVLCWARGASGEGCGMQAGLCICEDADGDRWDLTPLGGDHVVSGPGPSIWDYDYHFNFCDNIATQIPTPPCSFSNTMAYRLEDYTPATSATCFNMGPDVTNPSIPQEVTKVGGDASNGVAIKFAISTTTSLTVTLACKEANKGLVTAPAAPGYLTAAVTTWETYYSCPGAQGGTLSWGWPLLIIASVSVAVYAGGGVGYNYKTNNGEVAHPHADYWKQTKVDFVSLVSDGVWFSRVKVAENIKPLAFVAPADMTQPPSFDSEFDGLLGSGDGETSTSGRTSKSRSSGKKSSKDKKDRKKSKDKDKDKSKDSKKQKQAAEKEKERVTAPEGPRITAETERERRDREIRELASVGERVDDIESKEGGKKAPKE
jgi:hypothetical protein